MEIADDWEFDDFFRNITCENSIDMEEFLNVSLIPAAIIIIVLSFLEKRSKRCYLDEKLNRLGGYCGILSPLDIITYSNRWSLGFAFGITADKVMFMLFTEYHREGVPSWAKVFLVIAMAIRVGISLYPFFACLSTRYALLGAILGFLYTSAWLFITIVNLFLCPEGKIVGEHDNFIEAWPSLLCQFFLLCRFIHIFVKALRARCKLNTVNEESSFVEIHQMQHVQQLLRKPPPKPPQESWIRRKIYHWDPNFRFPSRIIATVVVIIICLYMFIVSEFFTAKTLFSRPLRALNDFISTGLLSPNNTLEGAFEVVDTLREFISVAEGVWIFSTVVASVMSFSYVINILANYRKHLKQLQAGQRYFLLSESITVSSSLSVVALGRFTACQIAYILWGYFIMHLVLWVVGMIVMYVFVLPMKRGEWMELLNKWGTVLLSCVIVMLLKKLEVLFAVRFFLQPKISPNDNQKPLALDNRKAFVNFSYFLFFHSVVVGLFSCLMRLLRSTMLGAWLIGRLDQPLMPKGYEAFDGGFKNWVGMLLMDHYHTNPVLVCFCHILDAQNRGTQLQRANEHTDITEMMGRVPRVSGKARTRWLLLYTLLNNPSLQKFRKPRLGCYSLDFPQNSSVSTIIVDPYNRPI
ncbi:stimulated by retinoic acid gene 6 protein-like isoform X2 [Rhineura floridana]|uniref:stimulated by retinoic acid gene 6 protein-like isoform X2 n=1 Tax=Rhineura floridana TaxID=261503 RepID=UPI002AC88C48|nr:stimulated by retinoic acid gene 6 protein-like isoform X2 [Rhineura floridana]